LRKAATLFSPFFLKPRPVGSLLKEMNPCPLQILERLLKNLEWTVERKEVPESFFHATRHPAKSWYIMRMPST
jgi:hypothetical protein